MPIELSAIIIVCTVVLIAYFAVFAVRTVHRRKRSIQLLERNNDKVRYAFVINPSKPQADQIRQEIVDFCASKNITSISFIDTQLDKDGSVCAKEALDNGADVVVAVGGDGTIRTVASALANTSHAMGVIPIGTGNLFARNLSIPVDDVQAALTIVTSHGSRFVDVGSVELLDRDSPQKHAFLVIAGVGFDALMIDDTNPRLKKNISWLAYFVSGVKHLFSDKIRGSLTYANADNNFSTYSNMNFRTILAGNCGQIPVFSLLPKAQYNDGVLDLAVIDTSAGLFGWATLFANVVRQTITGKPYQSSVSTSSRIKHIQTNHAQIQLAKAALVQVDGDLLGESCNVVFGIEREALCVRCPSKFSSLTPSDESSF